MVGTKKGPAGAGPFRAVNGARTRDPQLGKLMLYQLSYYRVCSAQSYETFYFPPRNRAEKLAEKDLFKYFWLNDVNNGNFLDFLLALFVT